MLLLFFLSGTLLAQEANYQLRIYEQADDNKVKILADNLEPFPITISLKITLKGTTLDRPLDQYYVLEPNSTEVLLSTIIKPNSSWSYRFSYTYSMGDALVKHDDGYAYQLPFPKGKSYRLTQGYNGRTTHRGINSLDFTMPKGDTILAAREGTFVRIKEDSNRGCPSASCMDDGNFVTILHDDGTLADYVHLQQNGVLVELGDQVQKGQAIALNGATGWASGAQLHFVVYITGNEAQKTLKVKFESKAGEVDYLQEGKLYKAF